MTLHGIYLDDSSLRDFCRRWQIRELAIFGSILRDDFRADSDVDFLFTLEDPSSLTFGTWAQMEQELASIVGRKVELVPRRSVEASENLFRRNRVLSAVREVYAEG
jgi:predicted nucleotidyltransferase